MASSGPSKWTERLASTASLRWPATRRGSRMRARMHGGVHQPRSKAGSGGPRASSACSPTTSSGHMRQRGWRPLALRRPRPRERSRRPRRSSPVEARRRPSPAARAKAGIENAPRKALPVHSLADAALPDLAVFADPHSRSSGRAWRGVPVGHAFDVPGYDSPRRSSPKPVKSPRVFRPWERVPVRVHPRDRTYVTPPWGYRVRKAGFWAAGSWV